MSDALARYILAQQNSDKPTEPYTGYLKAWDPVTGENVLTITGNVEWRNLSFIGDPSTITTGRVLLLRTDGSPVILGNIRRPVTGA